MAARISRASVIWASDGVKTSLASAICLGWIVPERAVHGQNAIGATGGNDGDRRHMPGVAIVGLAVIAVRQHEVVGLGAANAGRGHAHGGGIIRGTKAHGDQTGSGLGDLVDIGEACSGFDNDLEVDFLLAVFGGLNDDVFAGLILVVWRDAVFQIKVDDISCRGRHFGEDFRTRPGAKQLTTVRAGRGSWLDLKRHAKILRDLRNIVACWITRAVAYCQCCICELIKAGRVISVPS